MVPTWRNNRYFTRSLFPFSHMWKENKASVVTMKLKAKRRSNPKLQIRAQFLVCCRSVDSFDLLFFECGSIGFQLEV